MTATLLAPTRTRSASRSIQPRRTPSTLTPDETAAAPQRQMLCPACGEEALVEWSDMTASTSGPVVHVKLRCPQGGHWFLMLEDDIPCTTADVTPMVVDVRRGSIHGSAQGA